MLACLGRPIMKRQRQAVIKGSSLPVLRIVVRGGDARSLSTELTDTIENARPLLAEAIAVLDLREREAVNVSSAKIVETVRDANVRLAAILIAEPNERAALADLDLPIIEAPLSPRARPDRDPSAERVTSNRSEEASSSEPPIEQAVAATAPNQVTAHRTTEHQSSERLNAPALAPLFLTRPLRSGQRIYAQGRDAVVTAPTSQGSELIADGSIYAFSPLRGRVLAGASGDANACIVASHLDAELVAVAGVYRTFEADDLKVHGSGPVSVTLSVDAEGNERLTLASLVLPDSMQRK